MNLAKAQKVFPAYFNNFTMPSEAKGQTIQVYRACSTRRIEQASFLNTYEENGFKNSPDKREDDPQEYCMSTYIRLKDIKRFVIIDSKYQPPWVLGTGRTAPEQGFSCKTKDWKRKCRSSHVDYWLYVGSKPWEDFKETSYEYEYEHFPERR